MTGKLTSVMVIGATGTFGRRLAEQLAREPLVRLVIAGRTATRLATLAERLPGDVQTAVLNRFEVTDRTLRDLGIDVLIDASGPFQDGHGVLVEAAIRAGCYYLDLADGRAFVAGIGRYDALARAAGVAVITGASTTPGLTHAVLDDIAAGWRRIDSVYAAIAPDVRAARGPSIVRALLSYAGHPLRVFRDGDWRTTAAWSLTHWRRFPGLDTRLVSLCDTPDLQLIVTRFRPNISAEFFVGTEVTLLHRALSAAVWFVRRGYVRSLLPYAAFLRWLARPLEVFGSRRSGMVVEVRGQDRHGEPMVRRWSLVAKEGNRLCVPTLAALALVRRIAAGTFTVRGACACAGILSMADFAVDFRRLKIQTATETVVLPSPLFARALGPAFDTLPDVTRELHRPSPIGLWRGLVSVDGANGRFGRLISRSFGLPGDAARVPLCVVIEALEDGSERWTRVFPVGVMRSVMRNADPARGTIDECFGGIRVRLRLEADSTGLSLTPVAAWWHRLRLPRWLLPRGVAREAVNGSHHFFDVPVALPLIGRLVHYTGRLQPSAAIPGTRHDPSHRPRKRRRRAGNFPVSLRASASAGR